MGNDLFRGSIRIRSSGRTIVSIGDLRIPERRITFLFGESGIGKSLAAKALMGLLNPRELDVSIASPPAADFLASALARRIRRNGFYVFQEPSTHFNPLMTMGDQIREGALAGSDHETAIFRELWGGETLGRAEGLLPVFPKPYRPSGGEKQRMLLAMAFKKIDAGTTLPPGDEGLFVFDEPTGSLDDRLRNRFLAALLERFRRRPFTAIFITHDYSIISAVRSLPPDLRNAVVYRELSLRDGSLTCDEFTPELYTSWLANERARSPRTNAKLAPLLSVEGIVRTSELRLFVSKDPGGSEPCALNVYPGRMAYLKAPSGTGKTTLMKAIMGILPARRLRMTVLGTQVDERTPQAVWRRTIRGRAVTAVFQHADEALNLRSRVADVFRGLPLPERRAGTRPGELLRLAFADDEVGRLLPQRMEVLSGGQKQKLNLLRALVLDTEVMILDEPLNGLDLRSGQRILRMLDARRREGKGLLVISHNEEIFDIESDDAYYLHRTNP